MDSYSFLLIFLYFVLNAFLAVLSSIFFVNQKKEKDSLGLKVLLTILIAVSLSIYVLTSLSNFAQKSKSLAGSETIICLNGVLLILCFSTALFVYSLYDTEDDIICLEAPTFFESRKGSVKIGKTLNGNHKKYKFYLTLKDLEKHMFVCGATGTGKSNFIQHFLLNFTENYDIPFLLVEFKGEYHFLQNKIKDLIIIRPGENFSLNIFNPEGTLPEVHAERIFDILKSGQFLDDSSEFSPQMQKVLVEILTKVCQHKRIQNWDGFYRYCKAYSKKYKHEIPMLAQTLISITNRIRRFSLGSLKALFDTENKIKTRDLFEKNVLIDLSSIIRLGGEKADALFFLNMILKYLWDRNIARGAYNFKGITHMTIIEDAQYFAPKNLTKQTKLTSYLEDIALLQRGTGECLISVATHPDISEDILANCGGLIVFKTHMQKEFLCELLNHDQERQDYLSIIKEGQCLVRLNSIKRPFLLSVPLIERDYLNASEIDKNNDLVLRGPQESEKADEKRENIKLKLIKMIKTVKKPFKRFFNKLIEKLKKSEESEEVVKGENKKVKLIKKMESVKRIFKQFSGKLTEKLKKSEEIEEMNGDRSFYSQKMLELKKMEETTEVSFGCKTQNEGSTFGDEAARIEPEEEKDNEELGELRALIKELYLNQENTKPV